jgi:ornithine cyclodeaminase/alanine dehydrogenase-like protein (mu-crystallin family)
VNGLLHLDDVTIDALVDLGSVTESLGAAFAAWGRGEASTSRRVRAAAGGLMASAMAAVVPPYSGGKVYATRGGSFTFVITLFDADGRLLCTRDGDTITRLRTPAVSALAIRTLAAPDCGKAALIGTGRQAWSHLEMLHDELPGLTELAVYGRRQAPVALLVERARSAGIPAVTAPSAEHAVTGADVVITVTASSEPLFGGDVLCDHTLLCAVGATKYDRRELGADVVARCAAVVCDDIAGSRIECGDLIDAAACGAFDWERAIELSDVLAGNIVVPRAGDAPVLFETQGVALQDVAVAALAYERYCAGDRGARAANINQVDSEERTA